MLLTRSICVWFVAGPATDRQNWDWIKPVALLVPKAVLEQPMVALGAKLLLLGDQKIMYRAPWISQAQCILFNFF